MISNKVILEEEIQLYNMGFISEEVYLHAVFKVKYEYGCINKFKSIQ